MTREEKELFKNPPKVECVCGWKGEVGELTAEDDEDAVRCPRCGTVGWSFCLRQKGQA
jgi:hypothetical protein